MTEREEIVAAAHALLGIRYRHQGRNRHGLDCIGVPGLIGLERGYQSAMDWLADEACKGYGKEPDPDMLIPACERHLVNIEDAEIGDIYLMQWEARPRHFGVITHLDPPYIVHAYAPARKVCEIGIRGEWRDGVPWTSLIHSKWRYRELS